MAGLSNSDLYWPKSSDALYKKITKALYNRNYEYKGKTMLSGNISPNKYSVTSPSGLVSIPVKKAKIIINTVKWRDFLSEKPILAQRYIATLLHNLGAVISDGGSRFYSVVDMKKYVNHCFWNHKNAKIKGWFGNGDDDMRYFPVNRTSIDPELKVPCPVEPFPQGLCNLGGINYKIIDPKNNDGGSCLVRNKGQEVNIKLDRKAENIWMLGALSKHLKSGTVSAEIIFNYTNASTKTTTLRAGIHLNGYQYEKELEQGILAWMGKTPKWKEAVIW